MTTQNSNNMTALQGIRILEISTMVATPFTGKLLASLGADVVKIERPRTGDPSRRRGPFPSDDPHRERSGTFLYLNTGKRSVCLNLEEPQGRTILNQLVGLSDVVIHDKQPNMANTLGLLPDNLFQVNPKLIISSVTPYGSTGPDSNKYAKDINIFHSAGEGNLLPNGLALEHFPERAPITAGSLMGSYQGGLTAAVGILGAIFAKINGQIAQTVDCSIQEAQLNIGYLPIQRLESEGFEETRFSRFFRVGGVMPTDDGYIELLTLEPRQWEGLGKYLGEPDWASPDKFSDPATYGEGINENVRSWTKIRNKNDIYHDGQALGVPFAPYYTPGEIFENIHQRDRGFFKKLSHPEAGDYEYANLPFNMPETPTILKRAPLLGEHTKEIVSKLGYSKSEIIMLYRSGTI